MNFCLVANGYVTLGPMPWRKKYFESDLEDDLEIVTSLPETNTGVYVVNENVKFLPVEETSKPSFNSKIEYLGGPFWDIQADKVVMSYTPQEYTIDQAKGLLKGIIAENRWKKEVEGTTVVIQGVTVPITTKRIERDIFAQGLLLGADGATWKFDDGIWLTLSNLELQSIVTAIMTHVQSAFEWESTKVNEIDACTTLQQLDSVVLEP